MRKIAPLSAGFMLSSMLGLLISIVFVYKYDPSFGFAFIIIFALMFLGSIISMSNAPVNDAAFYQELGIHNKAHRKSTTTSKKKP